MSLLSIANTGPSCDYFEYSMAALWPLSGSYGSHFLANFAKTFIPFKKAWSDDYRARSKAESGMVWIPNNF